MGVIISSLKRSIKRNRGFLFVNITGLSIGLAVSLVLLLFVATELSYDRHFANRDRIIQLNTVWIEDGQQSIWPINTRTAYTELPSMIPGIESAVQIYRMSDVELEKDKQKYQNINLFYADSTFFDIFQMEFLGGSPESALARPGESVITDRLAMRLFGTTDALGLTFSADRATYTVSAVVRELPKNTHFTFDMIVPMNSLRFLSDLSGLEFFTYYLIRSEVPVEGTCRQIINTYSGMLTEGFKDFNSTFDARTVLLKDVYLKSEAQFGLGDTGNLKSVFLLAGLALLVLLLAITNFVNLFVVQGDARSLEVGIRKSVGAGKKEIAIQFFAEATAIVFVSFLIGVGLADMLQEPFSKLIGKAIVPGMVYSPLFLAGIASLIIITIFFSAGYPAFYLSRFKPVEVLKKIRRSAKRRFTFSMAVFQAVITIALLSVIVVVNRQLHYLQSLPKGYDAENVMMLAGVNQSVASHYNTVREELQKIPVVESVSAAQHIVGGGASGQGIYLQGTNSQSIKSVDEYRVFPGLCELMRFEIVDGNFFTDDSPFNESSVVLNEAAAKMLGISGDAVGQKVIMFDNPMEVIAVVRNFYYDSPANVVNPIVLTSYSTYPSVLYIRFTGSVSRGDAMQEILPVFREYDPDFVLNPLWCDDIYKRKFEKEKTLSAVVSASTSLSLLIALLGLIAIHSYSASRRTKEIGVRKALGESTVSIMTRLSSEVLVLVLLAGVIALPVSLLVANEWLGSYANRVPLSWWPFVIPVALQLAFSLLATLVVTVRASSQNPVDALRYE